MASLCRLSRRALVSVRGAAPDAAATFLQGLVTNDVRRLDADTRCMYAAFLDARGRTLFDSIVYAGSERDDYLVECDANAVTRFEAHLKRYLIRRNVDVRVATELAVWWSLGGDATSNSLADPRSELLGRRTIAAATASAGEIDARATSVDETAYARHRYRLGVAEGVDELPPGSAFPLEANLDYLNGVSFDKGCYVGQELTARTYHTGVVRKRVMPLQFERDAQLKFDTAVYGASDAKPIGKLRAVSGDVGLALLRVEQALAAPQLRIEGIVAETASPAWWPPNAAS